MTPEQRYLFDVTGYLHIKGAVKGDILKEAQEAVDRYIPVSYTHLTLPTIYSV